MMTADAATDEAFLRMAARIAERSEDARTQNGAVIAYGKGVVTAAPNRYPVVAWAGEPDRTVAPGKYTYIEHAERAVIYEAARYGWTLDNGTLYAVWAACPECARAIIMSGIRRVVSHLTPRIMTPERWCEQIRVADGMLADAGVKIELLAPKLDITIMFDGRMVTL